MSRSYCRWTADDTATVRRMARAGYPTRAIADHMDRDQAQIVRKMREHDIPTGFSPQHLAALARVNLRRRMAA